MLHLSVKRNSGVFPVQRYVFTMLGGKILYKRDESSSTATRIAVSLTYK